MHDFMIDLETMSLRHNAAIVALGAVQMNLDNLVLGEKFYATVSLQSSVNYGGHMDPNTILWWFKQSNAARAEISNATLTLPEALILFSKWISVRTPAGKSPNIWGNGASFDNVALANAYSACKIERPWTYRGERCYRTLKAMFPHVQPEEMSNMVEHNALHDAVYQANHLLLIYEHLKNTLPSTNV